MFKYQRVTEVTSPKQVSLLGMVYGETPVSPRTETGPFRSKPYVFESLRSKDMTSPPSLWLFFRDQLFHMRNFIAIQARVIEQSRGIDLRVQKKTPYSM